MGLHAAHLHHRHLPLLHLLPFAAAPGGGGGLRLGGPADLSPVKVLALDQVRPRGVDRLCSQGEVFRSVALSMHTIMLSLSKWKVTTRKRQARSVYSKTTQHNGHHQRQPIRTDEHVEAERGAGVVHAVDARGGVQDGGEVLRDEVQPPPD